MSGELPLYLGLIDGKSDTGQRRIARQACIYALLLCSFFFLLVGTLLLRLFDVPLSMGWVVGGVILTRVGFDLFNPPPSGRIVPRAEDGSANVAFVPLAMPIMFGPRAIATLISMVSTIKQSPGEMLHFLAASAAIVACMAMTYLTLATPSRFSASLADRASTRQRGLSGSSLPQWAWA
jgi:multiple antibiotic resistance protein